MKKVDYIVALLGMVMLISSCSTSYLADQTTQKNQDNQTQIISYLKAHKYDSTKTQSGVYYIVTDASKSTGKTVSVGDQMTFKYVLSLLDGTRIDSGTIAAAYGPTYSQPSGAIIEGVAALTEGEKGTLLIPSNLAYGSVAVGSIPAYSVLKIDVNVISYLSEDQQIDQYVATDTSITNHKYTLTNKSATGLRYIRTKPSTDTTTIVAGKSVTVTYSGKFLSNKIFDPGPSFTFVVGKGQVIAGFDEGILGMKNGESAILIMPSSIGYGANGTTNGAIPPYTPLAFTVTVNGVK